MHCIILLWQPCLRDEHVTQDREELVYEFRNLAHVESFTPGREDDAQQSQNHDLVEHFSSCPPGTVWRYIASPASLEIEVIRLVESGKRFHLGKG